MDYLVAEWLRFNLIGIMESPIKLKVYTFFEGVYELRN